jgi:hypothetical protein
MKLKACVSLRYFRRRRQPPTTLRRATVHSGAPNLSLPNRVASNRTRPARPLVTPCLLQDAYYAGTALLVSLTFGKKGARFCEKHLIHDRRIVLR